jgi:hypothetical protein
MKSKSLKDRIPVRERAMVWNELRNQSDAYKEAQQKEEEIKSLFHEMMLERLGKENFETFLGAQRIAVASRGIHIDLAKLVKAHNIPDNPDKPIKGVYNVYCLEPGYPTSISTSGTEVKELDRMIDLGELNPELVKILVQTIEEYREATARSRVYLHDTEPDFFEGWEGNYKLISGITYGRLRDKKPEWWKALLKACCYKESDFKELALDALGQEEKELKIEENKSEYDAAIWRARKFIIV